jgi:hypothetical protein
MSLSGAWQNSYGSIMSLTQDDDGLVSGAYRSSTGSSGTYYVLGLAAPTEPTARLGQPVSLTIFWRSIEPGKPDPSWHWVSGLGGQLTLQNGRPTLILLHALVATEDFPGLAPPGTWLDKLVFLPNTDDAATQPLPPALRRNATGMDPLDGSWVCEQDPGLSLQLSVLDAKYGTVQGSLSGADSRAVYGFTDSYATAAGLPLQGVALAVGVDPASGRSQCLAGHLDRAGGRLAFSAFDSRGTAADASYVQTSARALSFLRSG